MVFGGLGPRWAGVIALMHGWGIPAQNDQLYFFFSGPRLFPTLSPSNLVVALVIVVVVSLLSRSTRPSSPPVSPLEAMQTDE